MRKTIFLFLIFFAAVAAGRDYRPEEVANPNVTDRRAYVADPGGLVSQAAKELASRRLMLLRDSTSAEVAVAVVPSIGDVPIEDFAERLFTSWGIGKSDKDNGVLILIAPEQRRARIQTGYGAEGALPDIAAKRIIERTIVPHMREGDLDGAVVASADAVARVLLDPAAAEELRSNMGDARYEGEEEVQKAFKGFFRIVLVLFLLGAVILFISDLLKGRGKSRYEKSMIWHHHRKYYWSLGGFSLGLALPVALLAEWKRWRSRNKRMKCEVCGHKMRKLNEEEDNALLSESQDLEERLNTVDYDVWLCPECGSVERLPFRQDQSRYTECPNCHTVAMCEVRDHTLRPATVRSTGLGEKEYVCMYCGHNHRKRYDIPRLEDESLAVAAALGAAGAVGRRSGGGFGGGGFGGGFGGGSTGGGGASGGW